MGHHKNRKPEDRNAIAHAECGQYGKLKAFSEAAQALRDGRVVDDTKYQYTKKSKQLNVGATKIMRILAPFLIIEMNFFSQCKQMSH